MDICGLDGNDTLNMETRTKGEDTRVVDLRLDGGSRVEVHLSADLKRDVTRRARVVDRLSTSLDVGGDTVVVARSEGAEVAKTVEGDGVLRRAVANSSRVPGDLALSHVVRGLSTEEETVTAKNSVGGEGGALADASPGMVGISQVSAPCHVIMVRESAYLENVKERAGVEARLLVGGGEESRLGTSVGGESGLEVKLDTLGDLVVDLNLGLQDVGSRPGLGEDKTMGLVEELGLNVTSNEVGLGVTAAGNLEGDIGGRQGLDLEGDAAGGEVLAKEVVGRLSEVLYASTTDMSML